jgi:hypothetical protein
MKLQRHFFPLILFVVVTSTAAQNTAVQPPLNQEHQRLIEDQNRIREYHSKEEQARKRGDTKEAQMWAGRRYQAQEAAGIEQGRITRGEITQDKQDIENARQRLAEDQRLIEEFRNKEAEARKRGDGREAHQWALRRYQTQQAAGIEQGRITREEQELKKDH